MPKVFTLNEVAARLGCSRRTVERQISLGEGPALTRLSERRIGVSEQDLMEWVARRREPAPGAKAA